MINNFLYHFFAPTGRFEPCGMFTTPHFIAIFVCFIFITYFSIYFIKNKEKRSIDNVFRKTAVILTILELIKISHSFFYGELHLDAWFPLSYCGLFIFASWMAGYGKNHIKKIGEAYITYGCPIAGICFLIFPTTSLMSFPIWHYFSLYSLFFHSVMIFTGVVMLHNEKRLSKQTFLHYLYFIVLFSIIAIIINQVKGSNLMNLREPYNIPIAILQNMYSSFPFGYTIFVFIGYSFIPFIVGSLCGKIKFNRRDSNNC